MINRTVLAIGINIPAQEKIAIQKKLKLKDITLDVASIKDIIFTIIGGKIDVEIKDKDLKQYDYVWIQSGWNTTHMAYLLHLYLKSKEIPHNKTNAHSTKLSDIFSLASKNILVPNTFFHNGLKVNNENISDIEKICKLPCIYKTSLGSLGSNVYLIDKKTDIEQTIKENGKYNRYIFQEFIPNTFDYRVVISNGKPESVCRRTRIKDKFRNNVALGASEDFVNVKDVSKDILELAIQSAKALKLNWAGVDVVTDTDTGRNYVLEVNRRPGLTVKSSEISAACKYINDLVNITL
ncbi:MAG TPA: ATP-grasp domain-containing protein [Candidatus Dojkabacteria bacterium]|nr:ATP-grasp domain-containing protein [Candidatus Dojkabacteria bacterium]